MKKILLSLVLSLGLLLAVPLSVSAHRAVTDITGTVTNNGQVVRSAKVTVVCNGHTKHDKTNQSGVYLVQFKLLDCPDGATVVVNATDHSNSGSASGTVHSETTKLNIAVVNVSVPELGWFAGIAAAVMGGAAFLIIRRRQLNGHQA